MMNDSDFFVLCKEGSLQQINDAINKDFGLIRDNINDVGERKKAAWDIKTRVIQCCTKLAEVSFKELVETQDRIRDQGYAGTPAGTRMTNDNRKQRGTVIKNIAQIHIIVGDWLVTLLEEDKNSFEEAISLWKIAANMVDNECKEVFRESKGGALLGTSNDFIPSSERERIIKESKQKQKEAIKRRVDNYWNAHQSEKAELESEKKSLTEQIAALNKEIETIPQNTDGYALLVELQKKVETLNSDKKALGLFKLKEKKAVQEQIDSTNKEIAPIQARIDAAIEEVKQRISSHGSRIKAIDTELTKPR